jgi:hypothetical protein
MPSAGLPRNFLIKIYTHLLYFPSEFHVVLGSNNTITVIYTYGTIIRFQMFPLEHCDLRSFIRVRDGVFHNK